MKKYLPLIFVILLGCNEEPIGDVRGELAPRVLELSIFSTFSDYKNAPVGQSLNLVIGKSDEYESRVLIKFQYTDTTYTGLDEIKLIMKLNSEFENDTLAFSIHVLNNPFAEFEANWTHRTLDETWQTAGGDFESDSLREGIVEGDSVVLYFNFVELQELVQSNGIILIPRDTGFVYFESMQGTNGPRIELVKNESTTPIFAEMDCHIVWGPEPSVFDDWVGSGWFCRDFVKFNYDTLLNNNLAIYGELTFRCSGYFSNRDSIHVGIRELLEPYSTFDTPTGPLIALEKIEVGDTLVRVDIVKHIQRMIDHPDSNFGIVITLSPETFDISRLEIVRGSHALTAGYAEPPEPRW